MRLELFAGTLGGSGTIDGPAAIARFGVISDMAADAFGNLYVADTSNFNIRRIDAAGNVSTLAGSGASGSRDGTGTDASFFFISGITTDPQGNVYAGDPGNKNVRKITPAGVVTTLAGSGVTGSADGLANAAQFLSPLGIAADGSGNVYVVDGTAVRKITAAGVVTTLAGVARQSGFVDGAGAAARFQSPVAIAIDTAGRLYISDNHTIRMVTPDGSVSTLAGRAGVSGSDDGAGAQATFTAIMDLTMDAQGNVFALQLGIPSAIRRIAPDGSVSTVAILPERQFSSVSMRAGALVVASGSIVYSVAADGSLTPVAGSLQDPAGAVDGPRAEAHFGIIGGLAPDSAGNLWVAESGEPTLRRISPDGRVTTLIREPSNGVTSMSSDVATDGAGNAYFAVTACFSHAGFSSCSGNIRKVSPAGETTEVLPVSAGISPGYVAADAAGTVYVADTSHCVVDRIQPTGAVELVAGRSAVACFNGSADGTGASAQFSGLGAITLAAGGDLIVVDGHALRRITPGGVVTTIAGRADAPGDSDGMGAAARFKNPRGISSDDAGNVYVADTGNSVVRKVTPAGAVSTVAGMPGVVGFLPGVLPGVLANPSAVAVFGSDLYVGMNGGIAVIHERP